MIYNLRQFSKPEILSEVHPENLNAFLHGYPEYFGGISSFVLPDNGFNNNDDYARLAAELATPVFDGTTSLFEDLELIELMSRPKYAPLVLDHLEDAPYKQYFSPRCQALNNSLLVFLNEREALERIRQDVQLENPKSFIVVHGNGDVKDFQYDNKFADELQRRLDDIYDFKKYGRGVVVKHYSVNGEEYFLIRKGLPHTYQATVSKNYDTVGIFYRPEVFDVIIYSPKKDELKMALGGSRKWMRTVYPITFSKVFFGREDHFKEKRCLSFQTFEQNGEDSLRCLPGEPITCVMVNAIISKKYAPIPNLLEQHDRGIPLTQTNEVSDFFQNGKYFGLILKTLGEVIGLKLIFHFGPRQKRSITLKDGNCLGFKLDEKGLLIEKWLNEHGFLIS